MKVELKAAKVLEAERMPKSQKLLKLIDALEDNEDIQTVSHNAEIPESVTV